MHFSLKSKWKAIEADRWQPCAITQLKVYPLKVKKKQLSPPKLDDSYRYPHQNWIDQNHKS